MTKNDDPSEETQGRTGAPSGELNGGAFYAKTLFDRHGVLSSERSRLVERVLHLAYSAAHRRVKGSASWSVEELEILATHFGETLDEMFVAAAKSRAETATFTVGDLNFKCQLWVGAETSDPLPGDLIAIKEGPRWSVAPASPALTGPFFAVRQMLLESNAVFGSRIAVLDDQPAITESLCVFLRQAGFRADAFQSIATLKSATEVHPYDAYVLDWFVGQETVGELVVQLRDLDAVCPIAILTGKANERGEVVSEIANLVARYDVRYFSKPLDPHMITAVLSRLIAART